MAKLFASRPHNPDRAFVHALEEKLLGKKVSHWNKWLLWISLPSLTTAALVTALFIHPSSQAVPLSPPDTISSLSTELQSVEQDTIGTLNAIQQQLDL